MEDPGGKVPDLFELFEDEELFEVSVTERAPEAISITADGSVELKACFIQLVAEALVELGLVLLAESVNGGAPVDVYLVVLVLLERLPILLHKPLQICAIFISDNVRLFLSESNYK